MSMHGQTLHPRSPNAKCSRRDFFQKALVAVPIFSDHGKISPPTPVPDVGLVRHDGVTTTLGSLALGHATAIQLMFTDCATTCPIQAAIFQRVQSLVPAMAGKGIQLLSLSVNPSADTPQALSDWRLRFRAGSSWIAASPSVADSSLLQGFFGKASGSFADHATQVSIVDRRGRLVWRTIELPAAQEIATILQKI